MSKALTSWKEIAAYVGKGVRTVQRWEREIGFPVRRPNHSNKRMVLAIPEELDAWMLAQPVHDSDESNSTVTRLIGKVARLEQENAGLRDEVSRLRKESPQVPEDRGIAQLVQDPLLEQCLQVVHASMSARLDCAEAIEMARNLRVFRSLQNGSDCPPFQAQISRMLRWCAIAETDLLCGRVDEARRFIGKLSRMCEWIQSRLNEPKLAGAGTVPAKEQLSQLQARILSIESRLVTRSEIVQ